MACCFNHSMKMFAVRGTIRKKGAKSNEQRLGDLQSKSWNADSEVTVCKNVSTFHFIISRCNFRRQRDDVTAIVFGDTEIDGSSPNRQEVSFRRAVAHPDYFVLTQNDIVILELESPVTLTDYVRPVCLSGIKNELEAYDNCWLAAWGKINALNENSQFLQEAPSGVRSDDECRAELESYGITYHQTTLCGRIRPEVETHVCRGDAAAAMMCYGEDARWHLVGQLSGVAGECGDTHSFFNRVSYLRDYINETINRIEGM
ncbi:plasma kallikrein-like [Amphiura filiformis]|uniref:plasma kallikrein-like n=1 Tax=Amphiura filiformis TaxID=82378 RepID=UPI003B224D84